MPRPLRRRPKPDRRRALDLLASCRDGCTEAIMLAHGFSIDMMVELVNAGRQVRDGISAWQNLDAERVAPMPRAIREISFGQQRKN